MGRKPLPPEERHARRLATYARQRIKKGQIPGAVGKPADGEQRTIETIAGVTVIKKEPRKIIIPGKLSKNPTAEEMREFVIEMARAAADIGSAPAMIAAAQTLQKEIDRWERNKPPEITPPKPRPRVAVAVEIQTTQCPYCGKNHEI